MYVMTSLAAKMSVSAKLAVFVHGDLFALVD
jgi:hypothetical protein